MKMTGLQFVPIGFLILIAFYVNTAESLQCYQCINTEVESGSSFLKRSFKTKSDPQCANPTVIADLNTRDCESSNQVCGLVEGSVTIKVPLMGDLSIKMQARDCMDPPEDISTPKCFDDSNQVLGVAKGILNLLLSLSYDASVDGKACFCSTDLCTAGGCSGGTLGILGYCLEWYYLLIASGGGVLLLFLCTCCCCCCCRPCRSPKYRTVTGPAIATTTPGVVYVNSGGVAGIENPGYGRNNVVQ